MQTALEKLGYKVKMPPGEKICPWSITHPSIHSYIRFTITEHWLCARDCAEGFPRDPERNKAGPQSLRSSQSNSHTFIIVRSKKSSLPVILNPF